MTSHPYGPATFTLRRFLVSLAALGASQRARVIARFAEVSATPAFASADLALGQAIEGSGRIDARDALAGPLLQLLQRPGQHVGDELDPIAEPALAAALALLVEELISPDQFALLYDAIGTEIPRASLA